MQASLRRRRGRPNALGGAPPPRSALARPPTAGSVVFASFSVVSNTISSRHPHSVAAIERSTCSTASKPSGGLARSTRSSADRTRSTRNVRISPERSSSAARYHFAPWNTSPYGATIRSVSSRPGVAYRISARRFRRIAAASVRTTSVAGGCGSLGAQVHPRLPSRAPTRSTRRRWSSRTGGRVRSRSSST